MRKRRAPKRRSSRSEVRTLIVERIDASGDGVAEGLRIPYGMPGEEVIAAVSGKVAKIRERKSVSDDRYAPLCPHFGRPGDACGGCTLQHLGEDAALSLKKERLLAAVRRVYPDARIDVVHRSPPRSRRRAVFAVRPDGAGFRALGEQRIVPLRDCAVLHPELLSWTEPLRKLAARLGRSFDAQVTLTPEGIDAAFFGIGEEDLDLSARESIVRFAEEQNAARLTVDGTTFCERVLPTVTFGGTSVPLPSGVFLQATEEGEAALVSEVLEACRGKTRTGDLFAGLGTFSLPLAQQGEVWAIDAAGEAIAALGAAAKREGLPLKAEARDLFKRPVSAKELAAFGAIVFDPPRAGAGGQAAEIAAAGAATVVAVSCNPATLARDLAPFGAAYDLTRLALVDQFGWSPHIEAVAVLGRR